MNKSKSFLKSNKVLYLLNRFNMTYENFLAAITKCVQEEMGQEYQVLLHHVLKNNATPMDGLSILKIGEKASPTIYLNEFYKEWLNGRNIPEITHRIKKIYEMHCKKMEFHVEEFKDYEKIKGKLAVKLVNYNENLSVLKEIPFKRFLDLAIIYYVLVGKVGSNTASILVRQEHRRVWRISEEELFLQAMKNTPKLLPPELKSMNTLIQEVLSEQEATEKKEFVEGEIPMYVLTNTLRYHGAAAMLYKNVISDFAELIETDLYILPSSIHEVILIPKASDIGKPMLEQMVKEVNREEVESIERLSNHVYCYQRETGEFTL